MVSATILQYYLFILRHLMDIYCARLYNGTDFSPKLHSLLVYNSFNHFIDWASIPSRLADLVEGTRT